MGVYDKRWMLPIAEVLRELGSEHLLIIHSEDGLDEISIASKTYVTEMRENKISEYVICPEDFGFETTSLDELIVNSPEESLEIAKSAPERRVQNSWCDGLNDCRSSLICLRNLW